jgi:hypothetical protein
MRKRHGTCHICGHCGGQPVGNPSRRQCRRRPCTKESAFEAAIAAASLAIREGHEVHVSVPERDAGNRTATGAKN